MDEMISQNDLLNRSYRMVRGDGSIVSASVFLLPDGRVFGTRHPNESFWAIAGDSLEFLDQQRAVTTRFTQIVRDQAGWRLEGQFLPGAGPHARHILEESPCPIDRRDFDRNSVGTSVAVMLRTHFIDDRVLELMYHLNHERQNFDLYLTIDETNGRPETDLQNIIWHSVARCPELGLTQKRDRLLWWCGDFPFYFALSQIPQYQYYAMIEYDVHLIFPNATHRCSPCRLAVQMPLPCAMRLPGSMRWAPGCGGRIPGTTRCTFPPSASLKQPIPTSSR